VDQRELASKAADFVAEVHDLERVATRCATRRIGPRELWRLSDGLRAADQLRILLDQAGQTEGRVWPVGEGPAAAIATVLHPDAPAQLTKGGVIAAGVHPELDELRDLQADAQGHLDALLAREQLATGIPSLRVASNGVFGYFLEVRNSHADKVPAHWIRKQTLVNAERYITPELKELEEKLFKANDRIAALEYSLYTGLVEDLQAHVPDLLVLGSRVAEWDVLLGFAELAVRRGWARPQFSDQLEWEVRQGRHPVIERVLPAGQPYIPNDVVLHGDGERMWMITGPNMSGKSAVLRQTALHAILAQSGCFVPAESALLPVLDRLFGQPEPRRIYVHGGNDGNRVHFAQPDDPQSGAAGRNWPRHRYLRRNFSGASHCRIPPRPSRQTPGAVCHALPRTKRFGGPLAGDRQPARCRAGSQR
jgi:DNA mismatch repair protein MutS